MLLLLLLLALALFELTKEAAALASEPAADNAKRPEFVGGIPAEEIGTETLGGWPSPARAAGCGIIGNGGPCECDGNCWE